ncbi:NAD(P)-dependent dehydrogenase (short-subunit alcohol dehydrogenase family) [Actinokineospora baliensis]|uniref:SDR family NAD(P)-dependent oxidoreductase n=1 Tax=Actinokineospora baliensis TaxID=547056 RepID=UPI001958C537|nr:SDR family NAD(P)-dependent oxidoreductase [Actinokineospora baliensis]MBM7771687.1 NAD(P)-dependent dehydrogenase (short-subunit alcohol dehydrogenase family) [Actinokineospora baliensis]
MKRALVIGASHSLGAHVACRLAASGWSVVGTGRRPADEVPHAGEIDYRRLDLADLDAVDRFVADAPGYDLIVHNAVSYGPAHGDPMPDPAALEAMFRVNAVAPYRLLHGLLTRATDRFTSCVVINSDSIYRAGKHAGCYAATKAALRVLTTSLADIHRSTDTSVATLLLGPLPDPGKLAEFERVAQRLGVDTAEVTRRYLRKSNPSYVIDDLIDFDSCHRSVEYLAELGPAANGMVCRLDGGSAGSLI